MSCTERGTTAKLRAELGSAWHRFYQGKFNAEIASFCYRVEEELARLAREITTGSYQHGVYREKIIHEKKQRRLLVASIRDRVVHRLIYDALVPIFDRQFDPDVFSGRQGKGLTRALRRVQDLQRLAEKGGFAWRTDIQHFFDNVEHDILLKLLNGCPYYDLCRKVIDSYETTFGRGIPIGNLTSQIFANIYLHEFDCFVRRQLKPRGYLRYGDDMLLLFPTRHAAAHAADEGRWWLKNRLGLSVNPRNNYVGSSEQLFFLGHIITADSLVVDAFCTQKALKSVNFRNLGSYKSLYLLAEVRETLNRQVLEKIEQI